MAKVTMVIEDGATPDGEPGLFVELTSDPEFNSENLTPAQKIALSYASELVGEADEYNLIDDNEDRTIKPVDPSKH